MHNLLSGKVLAAVATLAVAAVIGFFAWQGFKAPPVATPAAIVTTPPGWVKLDAGAFTFYGPPGSQLRQAAKGALVYGDVVGSPLCVRFLAGKAAQPVVNEKTHPEFTDEAMVIDGRPAILRKTYLKDNEQQYWFPGCGTPIYLGLIVKDALADGGTVTIEITATGEYTADDAGILFKSVRFK